MSHNDDEAGVPYAPEEPCDHAVTHPDCPGTQDQQLPCVMHFAEVSLRAGERFGNYPALTAVLNHVIEHGWLNHMLLTWAAVWSRFMVTAQTTAQQAAASLRTVVYDAEDGSISPHPGLPWLNTLRTLGALALSRDGVGVYDTVLTTWAMPAPHRVQFTSALLASARYAAETNGATSRQVLLYHLFAGALRRPEEFAVIDDLVDVTASLADNDAAAARPLLRGLAVDADITIRSAAFTLSTQAVARCLVEMADPDFLVTVDLNGGGESGLVPSWRDESLDPVRPASVMPACWALRVAQAVADDDAERICRYVEQAHQPLLWMFDTTFGALNILGGAMRDVETRADAERTGAGPPPGHPG